MTYFFAFEADFVDSLRCIPMQVRMNLDTCGIKLKLSHWHSLTPEERKDLVTSPCTTPPEVAAYGALVKEVVASNTSLPLSTLPTEPHPPWMNSTSIPEEVANEAQSFGVVIPQSHWEYLNPLQRFALIKLSRGGHENKNFLPALKEFELYST